MELTVEVMVVGMVPMADIGSGCLMVKLTRANPTAAATADVVVTAGATAAVMVPDMEVVLRLIVNTQSQISRIPILESAGD
jgi:hypothetical protein